MEEASAPHATPAPAEVVSARPTRARPALTPRATVPRSDPGGRKLLRLLAPLGIVLAELGVAPLYALRPAIGGPHAISSAAGVLGLVSLLFWSLVLVVGLKYGVFLL